MAQKTELVDKGKYARYPYMKDYVQPTKTGKIFVGWKYNNHVYTPTDYAIEKNNPFGPINGDTNIYAVWEDEVLGVVKAGTNRTIIDAIGDSNDNPTKLYYWYEQASGNVTSGVTIEECSLDSGMTRIEFDEIGTPTTENNKNLKKIKIRQNTTNEKRFYRFRAKYNNQYSEVVEITQAAKGQIALPDFDYLTFRYNWGDSDGKDLDTATYVIGTGIPITNGYYRNKTDGTSIAKSDYDSKSEQEKENYEPFTLDAYPVGFYGFGVEGDRDYPPGGENVMLHNELVQYIKGGGDNRVSGNESALIKLKEIHKSDLLSQGISEIRCELYANWYELRKDGNCTIEFTTWKTDKGYESSSSMELVRDADGQTTFVFKPTDAHTKLKSQQTISGNVYASDAINVLRNYNAVDIHLDKYYSHVATLDYNIKTKDAILHNLMNNSEKSGRNIKFSVTVNNLTKTCDGQHQQGFANKNLFDFNENVYPYDDLSTKTFTIENVGLLINDIDQGARLTQSDSEIISWGYGRDWANVTTIRDSDNNITSINVEITQQNTTNNVRYLYLTLETQPIEQEFGDKVKGRFRITIIQYNN